jgi:hypothetical protein
MQDADDIDISHLNSQQILIEYGDMLEQVMFLDDQFAASFAIYPEVWVRYVLPKRNPYSRTLSTEPWIEFSQHHYTTIVRCWHAWTTRNEILKTCKEMEKQYDQFHLHALSLHSKFVEFFGSIGGAIDNMEKCFNDYPAKCREAFPKCLGSREVPWTLAWLYERRTQAVHMTLVPILEYAGAPCVDMSLFSTEDQAWTQTDYRNVEEISKIIDTAYAAFRSGMTRCWSELYRIMAQKEPTDRPKELSQSVICHGFGSGGLYPNNYEKTKQTH